MSPSTVSTGYTRNGKGVETITSALIPVGKFIRHHVMIIIAL